MNNSRRRVLTSAAWTAGGVLALCLTLVGSLLVIGNTERGRALIVSLTSRLTDGHVRLQGIGGSFPAALDLQRLELSDARGVWLSADRISLRWTPRDLLARHIQIDSLHVGRLHIERPPLPDKKPKPTHLPSIPHSDLTRLSIDTLELGAELAGAPASLVVTGTAHLRSLEDASANVQAHRTNGDGAYEVQLQFDPKRMDARLKLQEPAKGPLENLLQLPGLGALNVLATLQGPRNAEVIDLNINAGPLRGRAQGTVDLKTTVADLTYSLQAPAMTPYPELTWQSISLAGRWQGPVQAPRADGHLEVRQLQVPGGTRLGSLSAALAADAAGPLTVRANVDGLVIPGPQPALFQDAPLRLDANVKLNDPGRPIDLKATHRLFALQAHATTAGELAAHITLRLPTLAPFAQLGGQQMRGDATINSQLTYANSATRLTAEATASIDAGPAAWAGLLRGSNTRLQLAGELTDQKIAIERLQLNGAAISLSANGTIARADEQRLDMRVEAVLSDLARLSPALAGNLKLTGKASGPVNSLTTEADLSSTLSIHGSPSGALTASIHATGVPQSARGSLEAQGSLDGAPLALNISVEQAGGDAVHAIIRRGDWKTAHVEGDVTSGKDITRARGNLRLSMTHLGDLDRLLETTLQGSVAGNATITGSHAQIQMDARDVVTAGLTISSQLNAEGTSNALNIKLAAQSPAIGGEPASLTTVGQLNLNESVLRFATLEAGYHGQMLKLLQPARLSFGDGVSVDDLRLGAQVATLQVSGRLAPQLDARASLRQVRPELVNAFVPQLLATGTIQADVQAKGPYTSLNGNVKIDATGLRAANDAARGLPATDIHASAQLAGNTAAVDATLAAGSGSRLALKGQAPLAAAGHLDLKLTGDLDMGLLNPLLEARGRHVTGALAVDTVITGEPALPDIGGTVRLTKGSLRDYTQGTNLSDINGELSGAHGTLEVKTLTARAAPGTVAVTGTIGVLQPKIPVDLKFTARDAQPIANNIITANINADIHISGTARERLDVAGTVNVNRADIEIPSGLPPNVAVLDVRRPGRAAPPAPEKPLIIGLNVTLDAPRQILVKGRGLDAELGGQIRVLGTTDEPLVNGGFELQRGFFTLASSKLTFSNGMVTFNGAGLQNRIDPTLDFTAQSQVAEVTAIVKITGLADAPKIELSSTPDLPQDEILARLLFGVPASQLAALQVVQIGAALAALSGGGGLNPVAKIQKALGLDRLAVGGTSNATGTQNSGASIEAGRYVSSRVFVAVKESTTGASQLAVDVDLTKHLKLQTRLGNGTPTAQGTTPENDPGSSVGLAYQFEY